MMLKGSIFRNFSEANLSVIQLFFRHLILLACQKVVRLYYAADNLISRQGAAPFCKVKSGGTANICNLDILTTLTLRQCELEFQYLRPLSTLYTVAMRFP